MTKAIGSEKTYIGTNNENTSWQRSLIQVSLKCLDFAKKEQPSLPNGTQRHWRRCNIGTGA